MWEADCSWHRLGSCHQNIHKAFGMETNIIGHKQQHRRWIFQFEWSNSPPCFSSTWRLGKRRRSKMTFKQVAFENGQSRTNLTTCTAKFRTSKDQNLIVIFCPVTKAVLSYKYSEHVQTVTMSAWGSAKETPYKTAFALPSWEPHSLQAGCHRPCNFTSYQFPQSYR